MQALQQCTQPNHTGTAGVRWKVVRQKRDLWGCQLPIQHLGMTEVVKEILTAFKIPRNNCYLPEV